MRKEIIKLFNDNKERLAKKVSNNNTAWQYTRVSTKEQFDNYSLENQKGAIQTFARKKEYVITKTFGHTYESAKNDWTRKEFMSMIKEVRISRNKPYAILVYIISRFSRCPDAISLIQELTVKHGVHLIEVSSGLSTETEQGKLAIFEKVIQARRDNVERLTITMPGLKSFVELGNWLGAVPRGYSQTGPRSKLHSAKQKIFLNEEGLILREAWEWKRNGERDYIIRQKLKVKGVNISKQRLSAMWRNTFYAGISTNKILDQPTPGNWEKMVSVENFLAIKSILQDSGKTAYVQEKYNSNRPLHNTLLCPRCNSYLVGYSVTKNNNEMHYYKCNYHRGFNFNASSSRKSLQTGIHNLFQNLLEKFKIDTDDLELIGVQMGKILKHRDEHSSALNSKLINKKKISGYNLGLTKRGPLVSGFPHF